MTTLSALCDAIIVTEGQPSFKARFPNVCDDQLFVKLDSALTHAGTLIEKRNELQRRVRELETAQTSAGEAEARLLANVTRLEEQVRASTAQAATLKSAEENATALQKQLQEQQSAQETALQQLRTELQAAASAMQAKAVEEAEAALRAELVTTQSQLQQTTQERQAIDQAQQRVERERQDQANATVRLTAELGQLKTEMSALERAKGKYEALFTQLDTQLARAAAKAEAVWTDLQNPPAES